MASRTSPGRGGGSLSPSYAKFSLQRRQHPAEQRIDLALRERAYRIAERAAPRDAACPRRQTLPTVLIQHVQSLEQRTALTTQLRCRRGRRDGPGYHKGQVAYDGRLSRQRLVAHQRP